MQLTLNQSSPTMLRLARSVLQFYVYLAFQQITHSNRRSPLIWEEMQTANAVDVKLEVIISIQNQMMVTMHYIL